MADESKEVVMEEPAVVEEVAQKPITPKKVEGITPNEESTIKNVEVDGYTFQIDTDRIDDVEILDTIDAIENQKNLKEIIVFLQYLIGQEGYDKLKAHFVAKEGRFRLSKLFQIYQAIFEEFDPKG